MDRRRDEYIRLAAFQYTNKSKRSIGTTEALAGSVKLQCVRSVGRWVRPASQKKSTREWSRLDPTREISNLLTRPDTIPRSGHEP